MEAVNGLLAKLANDSDLHDDLKQPQVQVAMKHWTGQQRLPPDQAEKLMGDYRVMAVLGKIRGLQTVCQRAGIPVPLDTVLRRETSLRLPPGVAAPASVAVPAPAPAQAPAATGSAAAAAVAAAAAKPKAKEPKPEEEEGVSKAATTKNKKTATTKAKPPAAPAAPAATATAATVVKAPENWFQWLHLLSPLILMGLGLAYAAYRTARG